MAESHAFCRRTTAKVRICRRLPIRPEPCLWTTVDTLRDDGRINAPSAGREARMDEAAMARLLDERLDAKLDEKLDAKLQNYPTKQELSDAIARLATKQELHDEIARAIAPLATKRELEELRLEMRAGFVDVKHAFNVAIEGVRDQIRVFADAVLHFDNKVDRLHEEHDGRLNTHDVRLDRLDIRTTRLEEHTRLDDTRDS
jgi:hypothetical protein